MWLLDMEWCHCCVQRNVAKQFAQLSLDDVRLCCGFSNSQYKRLVSFLCSNVAKIKELHVNVFA